MRKVFNYFLKSHNFETNLESFRAKTLLLFILVGLVLLSTFIIKNALTTNFKSLYLSFIHFSFILTSLFLIKIGLYRWVGNILSVIIILVEASSAIFNYAGAESYNFFVDEYYLLLAFFTFLCNVFKQNDFGFKYHFNYWCFHKCLFVSERSISH